MKVGTHNETTTRRVLCLTSDFNLDQQRNNLFAKVNVILMSVNNHILVFIFFSVGQSESCKVRCKVVPAENRLMLDI